MESQPQNPEFRINSENFHPWAQILYSNGVGSQVLITLVTTFPPNAVQNLAIKYV